MKPKFVSIKEYKKDFKGKKSIEDNNKVTMKYLKLFMLFSRYI